MQHADSAGRQSRLRQEILSASRSHSVSHQNAVA